MNPKAKKIPLKFANPSLDLNSKNSFEALNLNPEVEVANFEVTSLVSNMAMDAGDVAEMDNGEEMQLGSNMAMDTQKDEN